MRSGASVCAVEPGQTALFGGRREGRRVAALGLGAGDGQDLWSPVTLPARSAVC